MFYSIPIFHQHYACMKIRKNNYWLFCILLVAARSIYTGAVQRTKSVLKERRCTRISWLKTDNVSWSKDVLYERSWLKHFTVLLVNRSKTPDYDVTPWRMKLTSTFILLLKGQHSVRICTFIILAYVFHLDVGFCDCALEKELNKIIKPSIFRSP